MDPQSYRRTTRIHPVSPPTRGWTRTMMDQRRLGTGGFPAHAGMEHSRSPPKWVSPPTRGWTVPIVDVAAGGFPRPRGDGPWRRVTKTTPMYPVSPPTRGWTPASLGGFPAHRGWTDVTGHYERWFPRPRGDGPFERSLMVRSAAVSPPTRGWTVRLYGDLSRRFPRPRGDGPVNAFPRPRGDGPWTPDRRGVSPPTRGWTPPHGGDGPIGVSPPTRGWTRQPIQCEVSPPTRGWTPAPNLAR